VAANEDVRLFFHKQGADPRSIPPGPPSDVQHDNSRAAPKFVNQQGAFRPNLVIVNVSINCPHRRHFLQGIENIEGADVTGMPDLVYTLQVMQNPIVHVPMRIRQQPDPNPVALHVRKVGIHSFICHMIHHLRPQVLLLAVFLNVFAGLQAQNHLSSEDKKARKFYDAALEMYLGRDLPGAVVELERALDRDADFVEAYLMLGQMKEELGLLSEAADALTEGLERNPRAYLRGHADRIRLLHLAGRYDEAAQALDDVEREEWLHAVRWEDGGLAAWHRVAASVRFAAEAYENPVEIAPHPLAGDVHTSFSEYGPTMTLNGLNLLFTREVEATDGHMHEEFFWSSRKDLDSPWSTAVELRGVNTPGNEGAATMTASGNSFIFAACESPRYGYFGREGKGSCDLFESVWDESTGTFDLGANLGAPNSPSWESQPTISPDGRTLMFARSIRSETGPSQSDIFISTRQDRFSPWGNPKPLPGAVNTPGHEGNPMLHPDGATLYFVSDGHPGMGAKDLFVSRRLPDGTWGPPVNLGYPINTAGDEGHLMVAPDGRVACFATDRDDPGNLDLWELELPADLRPQPVIALEGVVLDATDRQPLEATVEMLDDGGEVLAQLDATSGAFSVPVPLGSKWWFRAYHPGYLVSVQAFEASDLEPRQPIEIALDRLEPGRTIVLNHLRFASGSSTLEAGFQPDLDQYIAAFSASPELKVTIVGHTDNSGNRAENLKLSLSRAQAVLDYFVDAGLNPNRFTVTGRGDTEPMADNETPEGRALNRRTELVLMPED
jgi:outer membrane protein OmpA-like peptidoglycan-associated protein